MTSLANHKNCFVHVNWMNTTMERTARWQVHCAQIATKDQYVGKKVSISNVDAD